MTDSRPRPQYGEYATPEEQAKAIGIPLHDVHVHARAAAAPQPSPVEAPGGPAVGGSTIGSTGGSTEGGTTQLRPARRPRDSVTTVVLLGLGLAWVILSIPGASDLVGTLNRTYAIQGYTGHYGPVALASALGLAINISSIALWGITCAVSIAVLRRHRRAFYIPLIGAVVTGIVVLSLTLVAMLNDPGLIAYVNSLQK